MKASFILSFLSAIFVAVHSKSHDSLLVRSAAAKPYWPSPDTLETDDLLLEVQKRGLRLSKSAEGAMRRTFDQRQTVSPPKQDQGTGETTKRQPNQLYPAVEFKDPRKTLSQPSDSGKISHHPNKSQPSKSAPYKRRAGGGFIGHSRIPPNVPKQYSRVDATQIPPGLREEMHRQSDVEKDKSQGGNQRDSGRTTHEEPSRAFDPFDGKPWRGKRPPALTSIDDF